MKVTKQWKWNSLHGRNSTTLIRLKQLSVCKLVWKRVYTIRAAISLPFYGIWDCGSLFLLEITTFVPLRSKTSREMKKKYDYFIYYFPLFAFLFIGMGSILLSVSLSSCSSSVKNPLLLCADSLMEVSPDSALSILESISSPQKLSRADRALYALLLTQARHKNYVPLDDD